MKFIQGFVRTLNDRKITMESCNHWKYTQDKDSSGLDIEICNYFDPLGKEVVAQKIFNKECKSRVIGDMNAAGLYGQWLFNTNGKKIVITKDEIDAISLSQINSHKYPVVALNYGFNNAKKSLQKQLEWLETFEEIVFLFGDSEEGKRVSEECASLFSPGKVKVASLKYNSINDTLKVNKNNEVIDSIFKAKEYRPDGIINGKETLELIKKQLDSGVETLYPILNQKTLGLRKGEMWVITAGSGIGKSTVFKEIAYDLLMKGKTIGYIGLEESIKRTAESFVGIHLNKPIHLNKQGITDEDIDKAFNETLGTGRIYLYDHFGSLNTDNLLAKIRYLVKGCGCEYIFLDHISIVVSGISEGDERRIIDNVMTQLRSLTEETKMWLGIISHLKRPEGSKGHEDGAQTHLAQLRGSGAIAQLADMVIGLERNQQHTEDSNLSTIRILKNRYTGETGLADSLKYSKETGRLLPVDKNFTNIFDSNYKD